MEYTNKLVKLFEKYPNVDFNKATHLLKKGADINYQNESGATCLFLATHLGHREVFDFLIDNGADVNIANNSGVVPLSRALENEDYYMIMKLIKNGADFNKRDDRGNNPFLKSIAINDPSAFYYFISHGADVNYANADGFTPLMCACRFGSTFGSFGSNLKIPIIKMLLEKGANVNAQSNNGFTPLIYAIFIIKNFVDLSNIVKILIDNGANPNVQDNEGRTALMFASRYGDSTENVLKILTIIIGSGIVDASLQDNAGVDIFGHLIEDHRGHIIPIVDNYIKKTKEIKIAFANTLLGPEGLGLNPDNDIVNDLQEYIGKGGRKKTKKRIWKRKTKKQKNRR